MGNNWFGIQVEVMKDGFDNDGDGWRIFCVLASIKEDIFTGSGKRDWVSGHTNLKKYFLK